MMERKSCHFIGITLRGSHKAEGNKLRSAYAQQVSQRRKETFGSDESWLNSFDHAARTGLDYQDQASGRTDWSRYLAKELYVAVKTILKDFSRPEYQRVSDCCGQIRRMTRSGVVLIGGVQPLTQELGTEKAFTSAPVITRFPRL